MCARERRAAERGRGGADHRDADLDGGEELLRRVAEPLHCARRRAALLDELREPRLPERDDRDLGAREDAVREDEREDDGELDEDVVQDLASSRGATHAHRTPLRAYRRRCRPAGDSRGARRVHSPEYHPMDQP